VCAAGTCAPSRCDDTVRNGGETDIDCGGAACSRCHLGQHCARDADCEPAGCLDGTCVGPCRPPLIACKGACVDPRFDGANCGACGAPCPMGLWCELGACQPLCPPQTQGCGPACIDTQRDVLNCGGCAHVCAPFERCQAGACVPVCGPGQTPCGAQCVNLSVDPLNCGGCGRPCVPFQVCSMGQCGGWCEAPLLSCDAGTPCVDPRYDPDNCSGCGRACPPLPHAQRLCLQGGCARGGCAVGFADCNGLPLDGCEASLATDPLNCGGCGNSCATAAQCDAGTCSSAP
jgi:hypothetical protein